MNWVIYFVPPMLLGGLEAVRLVLGEDLTGNRWLYSAFLLVALAGMIWIGYIPVVPAHWVAQTSLSLQPENLLPGGETKPNTSPFNPW
jgi:hypothetical protein